MPANKRPRLRAPKNRRDGSGNDLPHARPEQTALPLDILEHIISFVAPSDLPSILRTSQALFPLAARRLYAIFHLPHGRSCWLLFDPADLSREWRQLINCRPKWAASPWSWLKALKLYSTSLVVRRSVEYSLPIGMFNIDPFPRLEVLEMDASILIEDITYGSLGFFENVRSTIVILRGKAELTIPQDHSVHLYKLFNEWRWTKRRLVITSTLTQLLLEFPLVYRTVEDQWRLEKPTWNWHQSSLIDLTGLRTLYIKFVSYPAVGNHTSSDWRLVSGYIGRHLFDIMKNGNFKLVVIGVCATSIWSTLSQEGIREGLRTRAVKESQVEVKEGTPAGLAAEQESKLGEMLARLEFVDEEEDCWRYGLRLTLGEER